LDLFAQQRHEHRRKASPLAVRMRPTSLDEFVGQQHFIGPGKLLRRMIEADRLSSVLFYGPPGTGKTTLAHIIAARTQAHFVHVNAAALSVAELRVILSEARQRLELGGARTLLFIDELHRFSRSQQDVLLDDVEQGFVLLIGATTENPFFTLRTPLISRSQIFSFEPLTQEQISDLLHRAAHDEARGMGRWNVELLGDGAEVLARLCDGDARRALTGLEVAVLSQAPEPTGTAVRIDAAIAAESMQRKAISYDAFGDQHYDAISALIKSMRGSDPDAAVYWLARMLAGGEDPRFLARRIVIAAAEDVGNADPQALVVAQAAASAVELVGLPECSLPLAQAVIYLACAPKSSACAQAIWQATHDVNEQRTRPVPAKLKATGYSGAKVLGSGEGYDYPHDHPEAIVARDDYGVEAVYYHPTDRGFEARILEYLARARALHKKSKKGIDSSKE